LTLKSRQSFSQIICPFCNEFQKKDSWHGWIYGKNAQAWHYECHCGKTFNYYESKEKIWTIPKNKTVLEKKS